MIFANDMPLPETHIDKWQVEPMRYAAKVDANHAEIVEALRRVGAQVQSLAMVGSGCPDILVAFHGSWYMLEIKDGTLPPSHRQLTPLEKLWLVRFGDVAPVFVVNSVDDALKAIGAV